MIRIRRIVAIFCLLLCLLPAGCFGGKYVRTQNVAYGNKPDLKMDVIQPEKPNGYAIIFVVSGGWVSDHSEIQPIGFYPLLDRGYTIFAVCHQSQPKSLIPEITQDIHRSIRFIRHNAAQWKIDKDHIGIAGGSAGGHLALMMATQGGPGAADARDEVDRESSAVQAAVCFYPPTDFLNYGKPGVDAVGVGILKDFKGAFGKQSDTAEGRKELGRKISPFNYVTAELPPTLIFHGDADELVPIQQAKIFVEKATAAGAKAKLVVRPGQGHGWDDILPDLQMTADWFDLHLRKIKK